MRSFSSRASTFPFRSRATRAALVALLGALAVPLPAFAHGRWHRGDDDDWYRPYPVYVAPAYPPPVYAAPAPVYVAPAYPAPVYAAPAPVYAVPPRAYAPPTYAANYGCGNGAVGGLIGAAAGGLLGSQFGRSSGKAAATIAGVLGGAMLGSSVGASSCE